MTVEPVVGQAAKRSRAKTRDVRLSLDEAIRYAITLLSQGRGAEALTIFGQAADLVPERPDLLHFHGIALHRTGSSERGLALIRQSLELDPSQAGWWNNQGNVLREIGRLDEAIDSFKQAIDIDDQFAQPYNNLGIVQREKHNFDIAEACFQQAIRLDPDLGDAYFNYGNLLVIRNRTAEGLKLLLKSMTLMPESMSSKRSLAYAYGQLGELDKAKGIYEQWLQAEPDNPVAKHHLSAVSGEIGARASDQYVRHIFDSFATTFDAKLEQLSYRAPELVNAALRSAMTLPRPRLVIADAGCGTGLCGPGLRDMAGQLIGVDLSSVMLGKAHERGCYDDLHEAELTAFLSGFESHFDAIVSADTLCYFGDLSGVFSASARSLRPNGVLVFTVEAAAADGPDILLGHHGRYAHTRAHVERTLSEAGLQVVDIAQEILRSESGIPVDGLVVTAARQA